MNYRKIVGAAVLELLTDNKKSQSWLADEMKVSTAYVNKIIKGKTPVGAAKVVQLAELFGLKLSEFFEMGENANEPGEGKNE